MISDRRRRGGRRRLALAVRDLGRRGRRPSWRYGRWAAYGCCARSWCGWCSRPRSSCSSRCCCSRASRFRRSRCSASGRLLILPSPAWSPSRPWRRTTAGTRGPAGRPSGARLSATAWRPIAYYALGVFAVVNLGASDVITALVTLPAGAIAIAILLVDEVDEAFANVYSTTMSVHNIVAPAGSPDRRGDHRRHGDAAGRPARTSVSTSPSSS